MFWVIEDSLLLLRLPIRMEEYVLARDLLVRKNDEKCLAVRHIDSVYTVSGHSLRLLSRLYVYILFLSILNRTDRTSKTKPNNLFIVTCWCLVYVSIEQKKEKKIILHCSSIPDQSLQ